jgi:hypothetical protein
LNDEWYTTGSTGVGSTCLGDVRRGNPVCASRLSNHWERKRNAITTRKNQVTDQDKDHTSTHLLAVECKAIAQRYEARSKQIGDYWKADRMCRERMLQVVVFLVVQMSIISVPCMEWGWHKSHPSTCIIRLVAWWHDWPVPVPVVVS